MPIKIDDLEIFITTHNRSKYLKEAIESILNQTVCVKEIRFLITKAQMIQKMLSIPLHQKVSNI